MSKKILRAILVALLQCDGLPMPEDALIEAAKLMCKPHEPTDGDVIDKLKTLQSEQFISGVTDALTQERTWTLLPKGLHKARELR